MIKDANAFTYTYGYFDHKLYYRGQFVTGAGSKERSRRRQTNLKFHKEQAEVEKARLERGHFSMIERRRIKEIDRLLDVTETTEKETANGRT